MPYSILALLSKEDRQSELGCEVIAILPKTKVEKNVLTWKSFDVILQPLVDTAERDKKEFTYVYSIARVPRVSANWKTP